MTIVDARDHARTRHVQARRRKCEVKITLERVCVMSEIVCAGAAFEAEMQQRGWRRKALGIVDARVRAQLKHVHSRSPKCDQNSDSREWLFLTEKAAVVSARSVCTS